MSFRVQILGSSSSGNATLIETGTTRFLLDAGFSGRRLTEMLATRDLKPTDLDAVFLTHEHSDHACGVRGLSKYAHLEFYATPDTAHDIQRNLSREVKWRTFTRDQKFRFRDCVVQAISLPHDAYDPVGFIFQTGRPDDLFEPVRQIAWMTDLGHIPAGLGEALREVDFLVLEANHDDALLDADEKRPFSVKQRIRGSHGHLSNAVAADFLRETSLPRLRQACLAHLSKDCNEVGVVRDTFGTQQGQARIDIIAPGGNSPVYDLGKS